MANLALDQAQQSTAVAELQSNPALQRGMKLISDPQFGGDVHAVTHSPARSSLLYAEIAWLLFIFLLRAKLLDGDRHWFKKALTRLWTAGLFLIGASVLLPIGILGPSYFNLLKGIFYLVSGK